jgi:hypothetical protein
MRETAKQESDLHNVCLLAICLLGQPTLAPLYFQIRPPQPIFSDWPLVSNLGLFFLMPHTKADGI